MRDQLVLDHYQKALVSLKTALDAPLDNNNFVRDSVIQRFEYSIELSWKILKRYLKIVHGQDESATRELFRLAERHGVIEDVGRWITYLDHRNLTSHTYNEDTALTVYAVAKDFYQDAMHLMKAIRNGYEQHQR